MPSDPESISNFIAGNLVINNKERQKLLETLSLENQLEMEMRIMKREVAELKNRLDMIHSHKYNNITKIN